jgi:acetyl/propionyl-CoA carboxylase alpha subunit
VGRLSSLSAYAMKTIKKLLVANRGEIARRIFATARRMGLSTVAVFSDADEQAPFVRDADEAVRIGAASATASYLNIDNVISAARLTGADAVHPGYGFLSENADFAQACLDAHLTFVGPPPQAIAAMGKKREAKMLAAACGVPLVPGFDGGDQSLEAFAGALSTMPLPVVLKPSSGGGGKGMCVVNSLAELPEAFSACQREATRAFGDPTLIAEAYLERPRHIEIQVLADTYGNAIHLFERECSVQRRHQKIIEESPSVAMTAELREAMGAAALRLVKSIGYSSAGTVEFLLSRQGQFYFSEMNTRLQVEHRVTEQVLQLDLVEEQIRIAQGERLRLTQDSVKPRGHAVEARLYAERPHAQFLPASGKILGYHEPRLDGVIFDSGIEAGSVVSTDYDPMLTKVISHGATRTEAVARLQAALARFEVLGVENNLSFLHEVLAHTEFASGDVHTQWIESTPALLLQPGSNLRRIALVATTIEHLLRLQASSQSTLNLLPGFRNNRFALSFALLQIADAEFTVRYRLLSSSSIEVFFDNVTEQYRFHKPSLNSLMLENAQGLCLTLKSAFLANVQHLKLDHHIWQVQVLPRFRTSSVSTTSGGLFAPMPGKVLKRCVTPGETVTRGQTLLILESMKMEQRTVSPHDGVVKEILVKEGEQVTAGQVLLAVEANS